MISKKLLFVLFFIQVICINAQNLPRQFQLSGDGRMLTIGEKPNNTFYNQNIVPILYLNFSDTANFWQDLITYHDSLWDYPASLVYNGVTYDSVGVRFKGNSSYDNIGTSLKKSFNISLDAFKNDQNINGFSTLNLNNCYDDPTFMREVFYENQIRKHVPAAQTNFAHLYINGADWGLYANVQQLNKDFQKDWFLSNEGANFRASRPPGSTGSGSIIQASFLNLGNDTSEYQKFYTLKSSESPDPWSKLKNFCIALDTTDPSRMSSLLSNYLDIDRALWFLASEIAFNDFDSYIEKGKNDFYVYYEKETGRFAPIEFDGNDVMDTHYVNSVSALRHQTDTLYPLMSKIINVPEIRQRYLAHMRTLVADEQDTLSAFPLIDSYYALIDSIVQADTIKLYSYAAFQDGPSILKYYLRLRRLKMLNNSEVNDIAPVITDVTLSSDSVYWKQPEAGHSVEIKAKVTSVNGISKVTLHAAAGFVGNFTKIPMFDDGQHADSLAGDGIFGASIPAQNGGTWMRYYVEAAGNNTAKSVSFEPPGAEHSIFIYLVKPSIAADTTTLVINELMARNNTTATDSAGQYEDWLELYNTSNQAIDISGYYLTDNENNLAKWQFPQGTIINANDYLIVWADEDQSQGKLHTNFKFSATGEQVILLNAAGELISKVAFGPQNIDVSFARIPNGTGAFSAQFPTFGINNNPKPLVNFSASATQACSSLLVNFTNNSTNASDYSWNFGDGSPLSTDVSPSHFYAAQGNYTVSLQANGGGWTSIDSMVNYIQVFAAPTVSFASDTIYSSTTTFMLDAGNGFVSYDWNTGEQTQTIQVDSSASYCVIVSNSNNCKDTACVYVFIPLPIAVALFSSDIQQGCAGLTVNFTNQSSNASSYTWNFGDGSSLSTAINPSHQYDTAGVYTVSLIANNTNSSNTFSLINYINAHPLPEFSFASDTIHGPSTTYLLDAGNLFSSYLWNTGDTVSAITVVNDSLYCVVVGNQYGCKDSDCVYVTINGLGTATLQEKSNAQLFPNPADSYLKFIPAFEEIHFAAIYNAQGAIVYSTSFTKELVVFTENWAPGIYLLQYDNANTRFVVKH